ncbi:MAG: cyaB [Verrucomicrobia bacterium]|jgi:class 3 adenylate cyclase|nr:cyaB [Verrucomicrobiota bacterium]
MKSLLPNFSFRFKLLLAMMFVVVGATGATLYVTQARMQVAYQRLFAERFTGQIAVFNSMQEARLATITAKCLELTQSVRIKAALEAAKESGDSQSLYQTTFDELNLRDAIVQVARQRRPLPDMALIRYLDAQGHEVPPPVVAFGGAVRMSKERVKSQLAEVSKVLAEGPLQQIGYLAMLDHGNRIRSVERLRGQEKQAELMEVIVTKIFDREDNLLGALVIGIPFANNTERNLSDYSRIKSGIWSDNMLYTTSLAPADAVEINTKMREMMETQRIKVEGTFDVRVGSEPHQVFFQRMNRESNFPATYQVSIYSMAEATQNQQDLESLIIRFGSMLLAGALLISVLLSNGFSAPIREMVTATSEIQKGNFNVRVTVRSKDEVGQLAKSFNEMTAELALKEKYRAVLDMVADKEVAHQMVHGAMALGGEKREISVLFCDIRGFTAHTQGMDPAEVIKMLNEHMTALTKVVYEHNGVVDKFVGDLVMAIFGAPKSYGNDAYNATRCAVRMIEERNKLNETSQHKITVGIGIATGEAVAGCMGSADRLNYTVLGARVNLASRLCSVAGRMEVVIDGATKEKVGEPLDVETVQDLTLKGFSQAVKAYKVIGVRAQKEEL